MYRELTEILQGYKCHNINLQGAVLKFYLLSKRVVGLRVADRVVAKPVMGLVSPLTALCALSQRCARTATRGSNSSTGLLLAAAEVVAAVLRLRARGSGEGQSSVDESGEVEWC